ncbi:MAG: DUF5723 family protein [Prevotellaceae bacterium]|jgi:hypothetical protein|nr:DUF5723 family protein [Prevotellaceae bacterium]
MTKKLITIFVCLALCFSVFAQQNMTLYQMHDITQSNSLNPSVAIDCKWNIGFPILGNISIAAGLPISYNDIGAGQEYFNVDKILSLSKNTNLTSTNIGLNILTVGYRTGDLYLQFTMDEKISAKMSFANDLVELLFRGNTPGRTLEANPVLSLSHYSELGFNAAYNLGNDLWVGARAKLLFGKTGVHSVNNILSLYTDPNDYALKLRSDLLVNASISGLETDIVGGKVDKFRLNPEIKDFIFNPANMGGAIDIGMNKVFESGWKVSASILNIGMINWKKNTHQLSKKAELNYSGTSSIKGWNDLADTLRSIVDDFTDESGKSFSQWLTPEVMAGVSYPVIEYMRVGATGYAGISSAGIPWAFTLTALTDNTSHIYGAVSYTITNNSFVNIGAGLGVRLGAFNLHAMTDNVLTFLNTASQRYATFQFGINFKFGCGEGGGSGKSKPTSIPCPSFGHSSRKAVTSIPCSSGK